MQKVRVTNEYFDKRQDRYPNLGDTFEVEENRAKVLVDAGVVEIMVEASDDGVPAEEISVDAIPEKQPEATRPPVKKRATKTAK